MRHLRYLHEVALERDGAAAAAPVLPGIQSATAEQLSAQLALTRASIDDILRAVAAATSAAAAAAAASATTSAAPPTTTTTTTTSASPRHRTPPPALEPPDARVGRGASTLSAASTSSTPTPHSPFGTSRSGSIEKRGGGGGGGGFLPSGLKVQLPLVGALRSSVGSGGTPPQSPGASPRSTRVAEEDVNWTRTEDNESRRLREKRERQGGKLSGAEEAALRSLQEKEQGFIAGGVQNLHGIMILMVRIVSCTVSKVDAKGEKLRREAERRETAAAAASSSSCSSAPATPACSSGGGGSPGGEDSEVSSSSAAAAPAAADAWCAKEVERKRSFEESARRKCSKLKVFAEVKLRELCHTTGRVDSKARHSDPQKFATRIVTSETNSYAFSATDGATGKFLLKDRETDALRVSVFINGVVKEKACTFDLHASDIVSKVSC